MLTQLTEQLYAFTVPNCKKIDKAVINHGNHTFLEVGYWTNEGSLGICAEPLEGDWEVAFPQISFHGIKSIFIISGHKHLDFEHLNVGENLFILLKKLA